MKAGPQIGAGISVAVAALIAFASIFAALSSQPSLPTNTDIGSSEIPDAPAHVAAETPPAAPAHAEEPEEEQKAPARQPAQEEPKEPDNLFSGVTTLDYRRIDRTILALVNEHRKETGLEPVRWDFELAAVAGRHSISMITGSFSHTDQSGFDVADRYRLNDISCSFPVTGKNAEGISKSAKSVLEMSNEQVAAMAVGGWSQTIIENPDAERVGAGFAFDSEGRLYSTINLC